MKVKSKIIGTFDEVEAQLVAKNVEMLSVEEFFKLAGKVYKKAGFVNKVDVQVYGPDHDLHSTVYIRPY